MIYYSILNCFNIRMLLSFKIENHKQLIINNLYKYKKRAGSISLGIPHFHYANLIYPIIS